MLKNNQNNDFQNAVFEAYQLRSDIDYCIEYSDAFVFSAANSILPSVVVSKLTGAVVPDKPTGEYIREFAFENDPPSNYDRWDTVPGTIKVKPLTPEQQKVIDDLNRELEIVYAEPADYFPEHIRKEAEIGEYAEAE